MSYNRVSVGTTATLIIDANTRRHSFLITNTSSGTVFMGLDADVLTSTGFSFPENANLTEDSGGEKVYMGPVFGIVETGTSDVRYQERTR